MFETPRSQKKTIGILGGMGPAASAHLYKRLIEIAQRQYGASQDGDFPAMVLNSIPLTEWDTTGFLELNSVKQQLVRGVQTLEDANCDFIIIGCNTVHHFYPEMQQSVSIPVVNMVEETVKRVLAAGLKSIGVLATTSNNKLGVYQKPLAAAGIECISVRPEDQEKVTGVISRVEAGVANEIDTATLKSLSEDMVARGAQGIILGCTELPLVIEQKDITIPLFNSTEILAQESMKICYGKRKLAPEITSVRAPIEIPTFSSTMVVA